MVSDSDEVLSQIVVNNAAREKNCLSRHACRSKNGTRRLPKLEEIPDRKNIRPIFFHDTDRIIHSRAYSRYIDKTQVFSLCKNDHITHRVLHVQFVSKIGRVIGRCLRLNEDLIEAIALGHDLGHAPYGHPGERVLHTICKENGIGCFCHNAQSARFLMEIEENGRGLNLSLQVLDGILCHNGETETTECKPDYGKTWQDFDKEYARCFSQEGYSKKIVPTTLEGCVVRVSDMIAYLGRDIDDAITLKLIERRQIPQAIAQRLGKTNDKIINTLVLDLVRNSHGKDHLAFSDDVFRALKDLKTFNEENIYFNPRIRTQECKIENMFRQLFSKYCDALQNRDTTCSIYRDFLNDMSQKYQRHTDFKRVVVDFIAGMTDDYFNDQFSELFVPQSYGHSFAIAGDT